MKIQPEKGKGPRGGAAEAAAAHMATARVGACLLVAVMCLSCGAAAAARSHEARLHRHLKRLNKKPVKSIEVRAPTKDSFSLPFVFSRDLNGDFFLPPSNLALLAAFGGRDLS